MKIFNDYIKEIKEVKDQLEHSGRTFLHNLLTNFTDKHKINIIHESKRDKQGRGAHICRKFSKLLIINDKIGN